MSSDNYGGTGYSLTDLDAMPQHVADARLAEAIVTRRAMLAENQQLLLEAESLLLERMNARGATLADCGPLEARLERTRSYDYDLEGLAQLQAHLDVDAYERAVTFIRPEPITKVSKAELNKLRKLGGEVARIIDAATTERPGAPRLVLARKAGG